MQQLDAAGRGGPTAPSGLRRAGRGGGGGHGHRHWRKDGGYCVGQGNQQKCFSKHAADIFHAIRRGNVEQAKGLAVTTLNTKDEIENTPLIAAIKQLSMQRRQHTHQGRRHHGPHLTDAERTENIKKIVAFFVTSPGIQLNATDWSGNNALQIAAYGYIKPGEWRNHLQPGKSAPTGGRHQRPLVTGDVPAYADIIQSIIDNSGAQKNIFLGQLKTIIDENQAAYPARTNDLQKIYDAYVKSQDAVDQELINAASNPANPPIAAEILENRISVLEGENKNLQQLATKAEAAFIEITNILKMHISAEQKLQKIAPLLAN